MNKNDILNMPAGREMDALIAVAIGWVIEDFTAISPSGGKWARNVHGDDGWLPYYSADIGAAFEILQAFGKKEYLWDLKNNSEGRGTPSTFCGFYKNNYIWSVVCEGAALAICRAALLAYEANI